MRYLFCSFATYGFLFPSIGIALELRGRGHEVAFVTGPKMRTMLDSVGLSRIARGRTDGDSFMLPLCGHPIETMRQVRHVEYALTHFAADVVVGQTLALGPPIAAERAKIPLATLGLGAYIWPVRGSTRADRYVKYVKARYEDFRKSFDLSRYIFGVPLSPDDPLRSPMLGDLFLLRSAPELEREPHTLPDRVHFVGDCLWDPGGRDPSLESWLDDAQMRSLPLVYAQPGRISNVPHLWTSLFGALTGERIRLVATVGRMERAEGATPDNFYVRPHVPQDAVLPRCQAVLTTCTTTTVLGALRHGRPLLLIPGGGGGEQTDLALRCVEAGVGIRLDPEKVNEATLRDALYTLVERGEEMAQRARTLGDALAHQGGAARVADLLEALAERRGPIVRGEALIKPEMLNHVSSA